MQLLHYARVRILRRHLDAEWGLVAVSLVIGAGAGLGAIVFRWLVETFTDLFTGAPDTPLGGVTGNSHLPALGACAVVLAPVVGGLLYGPLVHAFAREARGHGVPEVMYAVARRGGRIKPQVAVVKALASALTIGSGGSVGREGPIVQIGSALGSSVGGVLRVDDERRTLMVACGAAAGIAATFNAPLAGVFFAMELILTDFAARSFGMVVLSAVTASVLARGVLGDDPFLALPSFRVDHVAAYLLVAVLGLLAGGVGFVWSRVLYAVEDACDWLWRGPEWLRPAVGGLALGLLLLAVPQLYGVGYPVLGAAVAGHYAVGFLLVLLVAKMLATSLTIGIGGSGGVFAPSLFLGAMLGAAYGESVHALAPGAASEPGVYALIGMGAVFAGAARAPITAVLILFELTGEYSLILPIMVAVALATGLAQLCGRDTIYTLKLVRRGVGLLGTTPARGPAGAS
jgi:chloride channel protein, CIC family